MQEVMCELYATKKAHKEAMEAQRYEFQVELENLIEELHQIELCLIKLEYKMNTLKNQKQISELHLTRYTSNLKYSDNTV